MLSGSEIHAGEADQRAALRSANLTEIRKMSSEMAVRLCLIARRAATVRRCYEIRCEVVRGSAHTGIGSYKHHTPINELAIPIQMLRAAQSNVRAHDDLICLYDVSNNRHQPGSTAARNPHEAPAPTQAS
jgi:hypothetical protein